MSTAIEIGEVTLTTLEPEQLARVATELAEDKKAVEPKLLNMRGLVDYTDCLVITSGASDRQVKAIHDGIYAGLKDRYQLLPRHVEGTPEAGWMLLDYEDIVVHVFTPEMREFYRLDKLWGEAPELK